MSTPPDPTPVAAPPSAPVMPPPAPHAEDLDPEEDVAPNLGGEDRMQDA